jgi:hypothetical protein
MHSPFQAAKPEKNCAILGGLRRAKKLPQAKRKHKVSAGIWPFPRLARSAGFPVKLVVSKAGESYDSEGRPELRLRMPIEWNASGPKEKKRRGSAL